MFHKLAKLKHLHEVNDRLVDELNKVRGQIESLTLELERDGVNKRGGTVKK